MWDLLRTHGRSKDDLTAGLPPVAPPVLATSFSMPNPSSLSITSSALSAADTLSSQSPTAARTPGKMKMPRELRKLISKVISFKDLRLYIEDPHPDDAASVLNDVPESAAVAAPLAASLRRYGVEKNKLIIILVGLPARGKTFLCNKLKCYLNWLGHNTAHFNVGAYRRIQRGESEVQDASFFDSHNPVGMQARENALQAALVELFAYLATEDGQIAILDATNSTVDRRQKLITAFHGRFKYLFIETICNDPVVLEQNYINKMRYSPDYTGCGMQQMQALSDFKARIRKYEEVYEPIEDRALHYIKLTDMVTGRGHIDINRISGYIPGKIVFFLMQVCKAGLQGNTRKIWLTRHGESEFNQRGLIGGDSNLSTRGEEYARMLPEVLLERLPKTEDNEMVAISVWTSTLRRTIQTAGNLPFPKLKWKALDEIDAGICDGMTYSQIKERYADEFAARKRDKLRYRYPRGESYLDVVQRLEPVITEMERERESICIVAHQAVLRVIYGYLMARPQGGIPDIEIPLHTLIELTPRPDGTMSEVRLPVPVFLEDNNAFTPTMTPTMTPTVAATGTRTTVFAPQRPTSDCGGGLLPADLPPVRENAAEAEGVPSAVAATAEPRAVAPSHAAAAVATAAVVGAELDELTLASAVAPAAALAVPAAAS